MTDLQRVEISGFKGIEHLEYEPSGVNLVTGRNNTGKTSLLEAIALAFDPTYVEEFGEDIDSLIHKDEAFEECRIVMETSEEEREMEIRHPTDKETERYFTSFISSQIYERLSLLIASPDGQTFLDSYKDSSDKIPKEVEDRLPNLVRAVVEEYLENSSTKELKKKCLMFVLDEGTYPYVAYNEITWGLIEKSANALSEIVKKEIPIPSEYQERNQDLNWSVYLSNNTFTGAYTHFGFLNEPPIPEVDVNSIKSKNLLSAPEFDPDEDAIKRDDLGDYLKETGLADELKTFNLDTLVFEKEDGEKYSVPYDFMGDGFKTVVGLLWELMDDEIENQVVLLEEPENHMHPGYVRKVVYFLVELAKDEDVQLFITTHNKDFIDTFFSENLRDEEVEFLEDEFTLVRMESHSAVVEDYETARESIEDLHLDLRGI